MSKFTSSVPTAHSRVRGFTLVEVLVAAAITGIGIAAVLGGFAAISRSERVVAERGVMERVAFDKFNELQATREYKNLPLDGDADGVYGDRFRWSAQLDTTDVEDLVGVTVTVEPKDGSTPISVTGLIYQPPETTTGAGATAP